MPAPSGQATCGVLFSRPNCLDCCRIDSLSVLPASFASQDASRILSLCRSVLVAVKVMLCYLMFFAGAIIILFRIIYGNLLHCFCWHALFNSFFNVAFQSNKALILGESYIFSMRFVKVQPLSN